jgi:CDP-4-dehydro-6-deoxyglucose reductase
MKARLLDWRELAPEVRHFSFEVPGVDAFPFQPGQWVSLSREINGRKITRAYSIASIPDGNRFALCLNRVQDGAFSPFLFDLAPRAEVDLKGPYGSFVLRNPGRDMVMIATGTGVAPMRSMVEQYLRDGGQSAVTLLFGVRYPETVLYRSDFERWQAEHPNFRFHPTLSRPPASWTGWRGHVQQHLEEVLGGRTAVDVYICGLKAMVDDVRERLKAAGFDRKQIIYEKYD